MRTKENININLRCMLSRMILSQDGVEITAAHGSKKLRS